MDMLSALKYEAERLRKQRWKLPPERDGHPADTDLLARRGGMAAAPAPVVPDSVRVSEERVGGVACTVTTPAVAEASSVLLYFHGGGYRLGSAAGWVAYAARLTQASGAKVVLVDYRLAPEHPFPAALWDAACTYDVLTAPTAAPLPVYVGGDSAGGGLAAALIVACVTSGVPVPAGLIAISPWSDLRNVAGTFTTNAAKDTMVSTESLNGATALYCQGHDMADPLVSPHFADPAVLAQFPARNLVFAGGDEALLDDSLALAAALARAGRSVTLHVEAGMQHIYPVIFGDLPPSAAALAMMGRFLTQA